MRVLMLSFQGTRVYIWNLWQTSDNLPELDFITDVYDVRLRGHEDDLLEVSGRKKKADEGMKRCHSYRHSLRSYVSMLYLQWPEVEHVFVRLLLSISPSVGFPDHRARKRSHSSAGDSRHEACGCL